MVVPAQWERTGDFSEGLAAVKQTEKWGFIDKSGKMVIAPQFGDYRFGFSQRLACVKQNGKCGLIDKNGASVVKPEWNLIEKYQEARDTPVYWEAAPQDGEQVHVEFLDNTGKAICSSESFQSGSVKPAASSEDLDSEPPILEYRELIRTAPPLITPTRLVSKSAKRFNNSFSSQRSS